MFFSNFYWNITDFSTCLIHCHYKMRVVTNLEHWTAHCSMLWSLNMRHLQLHNQSLVTWLLLCDLIGWSDQVDWLEDCDWLIRYNLFGMIWPHETLITPGTRSTHTWSRLTLLLILIPDHCANQYMWIYKDNPFMFLKTQYISWKVFLFFSHYSKPFRLAALIE